MFLLQCARVREKSVAILMWWQHTGEYESYLPIPLYTPIGFMMRRHCIKVLLVSLLLLRVLFVSELVPGIFTSF